jgi:hypothetical protein
VKKERKLLAIILPQPVFPLLFIPLHLPVNLLMLLKEHESGNGMRSKSNETRHPALEDPAQTFFGRDVPDKTHDAFLRLCAHDAGLDHIDRTANRRRDETSHDRSAEMRGEIVAQVGPLQKLRLENIVTCELRRGHEDCADAVGPDAAEQAAHAFVFDHARETVDGVLVVATLLYGEGSVVLHSHVEDVGGIAGDAAEET